MAANTGVGRMHALNLFRNDDNRQTFAAGAQIFAADEPGQNMYVVNDGRVDIVSDGRVLETVGPGGIFGEMALIDKAHRSAGAVAKTDCTLVLIDERRFLYLVQESPFFALSVMGVMADRLRRVTNLTSAVS